MATRLEYIKDMGTLRACIANRMARFVYDDHSHELAHLTWLDEPDEDLADMLERGRFAVLIEEDGSPISEDD